MDAGPVPDTLVSTVVPEIPVAGSPVPVVTTSNAPVPAPAVTVKVLPLRSSL